MRGPPPHWNPPSPPLPEQNVMNPRLEESQYEEPQMPVDMVASESAFGRPSISGRIPLAVNNNYSLSNAQQMRNAARSRNARPETSGVASPWDDETRQMLVQNPETGSFYVPTGSGKMFFFFWLFLMLFAFFSSFLFVVTISVSIII
ncbi:unnamed protein product [Enterobius vermicularis]|uniref:Uncharacterized protein n=1 Tax=Enterobius vermicularis TaxID=51028 RepID=A0A0N4UZ04_ENTVE|nr:unnamed protein product [Enterobius vermicularis]